MHDAIGMDVVQGPHQLLGDLADLFLLEGLVVLDDIEEFSLAELGDQNELGMRLEGV